jgi:hypothetical protein
LDLTESNEMQRMDFEHVSRKQLNELEIRVHELISLIRKAKLKDEPLQDSLKLLEQKLGETRRKRFDETTPEYKGY